MPPRFRGRLGHQTALRKWLRLTYPSLSLEARMALGEAATSHWLDWTLDSVWPNLEPFVREMLVLPKHGRSREVLLETATTLYLQMRWRRLREDRLEEVRGDPVHFQDRAFVSWLLHQPAALLLDWAAHFLRAMAPPARRDAAFRLSRLRPMPLPILRAWTVFQQKRVAQTWRPSDDELHIHCTVSAAAQWLEWWASNQRRYWWPIEQVDLASAASTVRFALEGTSTGRLTISREVFERALNLALRSTDPPAPPAQLAEKLGDTTNGRMRLHLVRTASPEVVALPPSTYDAFRCSVCQHAGDAASDVKKFPPYRIACTCELVLDWEREPLSEAPYDWAMLRWVESVHAKVCYPFPAMRLLFKMNEEHLEDRRNAESDAV